MSNIDPVNQKLTQKITPQIKTHRAIESETTTQKIKTAKAQNPLLLVFKAMKVAKGLFRDAFKETKKSNKVIERQWENISKWIAGKYDDAHSKQTWNSYALCIPVAIEAAGGYAMKGNERHFMKPSVSLLSGSINQLIEGRNKQIQNDIQAETVPLNMRSQAYTSLYQNAGSDQSNEKQQVSEVDRLTREMMQQESQIFQGSARGA